MKVLIKGAKIIDPGSAFHRQVKDILAINGKISSISSRIPVRDGVKLIESKGLHVSPGWVDLHATLSDPGFEYKEDLHSGALAAAQGGFTAVVCMPKTNPVLHSKSEIEYIFRKTSSSIVDVLPAGAVSYNLDGETITEMYDMKEAGAVAFSDGDQPIKSAALMLRSLLYVKPFEGLIYSHANDPTLSFHGTMNEGQVSTSLGLKGIPEVAEELMVIRDIYLAEYSGSKVHFTCVSTRKSVDLIRAAKARGIKVTAAVAAHHLLLTDRELEGFGTNYKVSPPLRGTGSAKALIKGLADGTIDAICSQHTPHDEDAKKVEFNEAAFGMTGLETAFAVANTALKGKLSMEALVEKFAVRPRKILNLPVPTLKAGGSANLTLFDPARKWTFTEDHIRSKSRNSPFIGHTFTGKVIGIINKDQVYLAS